MHSDLFLIISGIAIIPLMLFLNVDCVSASDILKCVPAGTFIDYRNASEEDASGGEIKISGVLRSTGDILILEKAVFSEKKVSIRWYRLERGSSGRVPGAGRRTEVVTVTGKVIPPEFPGYPPVIRVKSLEENIHVAAEIEKLWDDAEKRFEAYEKKIRSINIDSIEKHISNRWVDLKKITFKTPVRDDRLFFWDDEQKKLGFFVREAIIYDGEIFRRYLRIYAIYDFYQKKIEALAVTACGERLE